MLLNNISQITGVYDIHLGLVSPRLNELKVLGRGVKTHNRQSLPKETTSRLNKIFLSCLPFHCTGQKNLTKLKTIATTKMNETLSSTGKKQK